MNPKSMFGLMICDKMKYSVVVSNQIPLFEFSNNEWSKIKHDEIHSIIFHKIIQFSFCRI